MNSKAFEYTAFGLRIASEIELPELAKSRTSGTVDLEIRLGETPRRLRGGVEVESGVWARPGAMLIENDTARYLVQNGAEVVISPGPGKSQRDVRAFLLGSAMGAICHQRGLLPLHANAIEVDGHAVAFAGASGSGKSTLAVHFRQGGRRLLCDDVCVIGFDAAGGPVAWPGIARIKLWSDSLAAMGHIADNLEPVLDRENKFSLPFPPDPLMQAIPLARIYMLRTADPQSCSTIVPLSGAEAFDNTLINVYRREFAAPLGQARTLFANVAALVRATEVFAAEREWGFDVFRAQAEALERHIEIVKQFIAGGAS